MDVAVAPRIGPLDWVRARRRNVAVSIGLPCFLVFVFIQLVPTYHLFLKTRTYWLQHQAQRLLFDHDTRQLFEHSSWLPVWLRFPYAGWLMGALRASPC